MSIQIESAVTHPTSAIKMAIMLILAFISSILSMIGMYFVVVLAPWALTPTSGPSPIPTLPYNPTGGLHLLGWAFLLFLASGLVISLYPEHGWRQALAGLLFAVTLSMGLALYEITYYFHIYTGFFIIEISIYIAIVVAMPVSGRVKGWADIIGLAVGGLISGLGLSILHLWILNSPANSAYSSFASICIWWNTVFFSELFSHRLSKSGVFAGTLLWALLIVLELLLVLVLVT